MRKITLHEVGMENYGPYIDPMILPFPNDNVTLLTGPNGVGKTMALDAIPFTLFGTTSKGLKGDDLVNNVVDKKCHTWVKFSINKDKYLVKRYQKYAKFGGNNVVLNKNGVDIKSGSREVIPEIERLWCTQKSFMNTLMFGQKVKDFFTDLTDSRQKEIFRKLLGLDNYVDYYKQADSIMKSISRYLQEEEQEIAVNRGVLAEINERIEELTKIKIQFGIDILTRIKELKLSVDNSNRIIEKWKENISELISKDHDPLQVQIDINILQTQIDDIQAENNIQEQKLSIKKTEKIYELKAAADKSKEYFTMNYNKTKDKKVGEWREAESEIKENIKELTEKRHKFEVDLQAFKTQILSFEQHINKINKSVFESQLASCPTCLQEITNDVKQHLKDEIAKSSDSIVNFEKNITQLTADIYALNVKMSKKQVNLNDVNIQYDVQLKALKQEHSKELKYIDQRKEEVLEKVEVTAQKQLSLIQSNSLKKNHKLNETMQQLIDKKVEVVKVKQELYTAEQSLQTAEQSKEFILREIGQKEQEEYDDTQLNSYIARSIQFTKDIDTSIKKIVSDKRKYDIAEFWKSAYSPTGIPSTLIDEAIPFMNKKVAEYLEEISNGRYIISFDTQDTIKSGETRDKISVKVLDTQTRANKRLQLSGGQTRLVDIATVLTLGDLQSKNLGMKVNLLIFDEIFDSLDAQNIDYVSKVLTRLKKGKSIYLISHTHQDQLEADHILEFKT